MRKIENHAELAALMEAGKGYILNCRPERGMLHTATCSYAEIMSPREYEKLHFDDLSEAYALCSERFGKQGWKRCGHCL